MFKPNKKNLIYLVVLLLSFFLVSSVIPAFRASVPDISKFPINFLTSIQREFKGLIFYHRNYLQNERLVNEIYILRRRFNGMQELLAENNRLKDLLSFKQKSSYKVIAAHVIGRAPDNWNSALIIDKGSLNGIKSGMTVMTYLGLVGRVAEVSKSASKIMLVTDPDFAISAVLQRSRQQGLVVGALGNLLVMKYLAHDTDIKPGDVVVSAGLTDAYPKGLIIGTVTEFIEDSSGLSYYCLIKPAVNLFNLEEVLVIVS